MMAGCVGAILLIGVILAAGGPRWLAYLAVLACPIMMIFMHGAHGEHDGSAAEHDEQPDQHRA
jgi:hypothetical protein